MRILVNILALLGVIIAVFMVGSLYLGLMSDGFSGGRGMAVLFFQLWGAIGSVVAILFGFIGRRMDRRVPLPAGRIANTSVAVGLVCGLLLFAAPFVFG